MSAFCQRAQYRTLEQYLRENSPDKLEFVETACGSPAEVEREFWPVRLWLAYKEASFGLPPAFDDGGERLWHPMLLQWWDHDICTLSEWFYGVPDRILRSLGIRQQREGDGWGWHIAIPRILPPIPCFPLGACSPSALTLQA